MLSKFKATLKELVSQTDSSNGKVELISRAHQAAPKALMKFGKRTAQYLPKTRRL